jgi:hypothetical protein
MNDNAIEKLKIKVKETSQIVENTLEIQTKLIATNKDINLKLRNYIEADIAEKRLYEDANSKVTSIRGRIENCKNILKTIRDKMNTIKLN